MKKPYITNYEDINQVKLKNTLGPRRTYITNTIEDSDPDEFSYSNENSRCTFTIEDSDPDD